MSEPSKAERIRKLFARYPRTTVREAATLLGCSASYVSEVRRGQKGGQDLRDAVVEASLAYWAETDPGKSGELCADWQHAVRALRAHERGE